MSEITAIETQKKRANRRSIYVDGEFLVGVHEDVVAALNLSVGQTLERDRLVELVKAETACRARQSALRLINYRDRSKAEIRKRLIGKDYPEEIVEEVIDELSRSGLLDDEKFSRDWVRARSAARPMGRKRLAWELAARGLDKGTVQTVLDGLDEKAEYELALAAAAKKAAKANRDDPKLKNRIASFLRRRGFNWDTTARVVNELLR